MTPTNASRGLLDSFSCAFLFKCCVLQRAITQRACFHRLTPGAPDLQRRQQDAYFSITDWIVKMCWTHPKTCIFRQYILWNIPDDKLAWHQGTYHYVGPDMFYKINQWIWSRQSGSNRPPKDYESSALPLSYSGCNLQDAGYHKVIVCCMHPKISNWMVPYFALPFGAIWHAHRLAPVAISHIADSTRAHYNGIHPC